MDKIDITKTEADCILQGSRRSKSILVTEKGLPMAEPILVTYRTANWEA